jgi:hypothetical protein
MVIYIYLFFSIHCEFLYWILNCFDVLQILHNDLFVLRYVSWQLELKLGLGGTSYEDFIRSMHLPLQLRYHFPIRNLKLDANKTVVSASYMFVLIRIFGSRS